ncbi:MAG TPA: Xaa-Pro peptidase family protein [Desulfohalobiaceae bacterium]|nr:Xaa-Pro peptidase family protein [Desulfohalobiaceae bacterium]
MYAPMDKIPQKELEMRWGRLRQLLQEHIPTASGMLVFSRLNIYWLSGHFGNGMFWLPIDDNPVLFVRKGKERAELDSSVQQIASFRSFKEFTKIISDFGQKCPRKIAVEKTALSWAFGEQLQQRLSDIDCLPGDVLLDWARSIKSDWEVNKISLAGQRHFHCLYDLLPEKIEPGMSEWQIASQIWQDCFALGHQGILRMRNLGEEMFLGCVSAGESGNFPTSLNSPDGYRGAHPAAPHMGYAGKIWSKEEVLMVDICFSLEGYHSDKTQVYWSGSKEDLPVKVRKAHEFCLELHDWVAEHMYPGTTPEELARYCFDKVEERGWTGNFMGLGGNAVPFVGHGIGLCVDEWPAIAMKFRTPIEKNMVLAVEPKLGISEYGMVGVENTFLVTEKGGQSLTGEKYDLICLE